MTTSTRREWLGQTSDYLAAVAAGAVFAGTAAMETHTAHAQESTSPELKGNIRHSLVHWCYKDYWKDIQEFCRQAKKLGVQSVELVDPVYWPVLKEHGLTCAIASSHGFVKGVNDPANHEECLTVLRKKIDQAADFGCPSVITFTGMRANSKGVVIPDDVGMANCVKAYKQIAGYAEEKQVTLCLEHLNSRVSTHPMKGHPGYQGDHVDYCIEILKQVGSPRVKLLFDIYHVQIMDGDLISRIHQHKDWLGHIHTAGNPGRGELHVNQEVNYPAVMQALLDVGYQGYVGHEFIPTMDPAIGLKEAIHLCDV